VSLTAACWRHGAWRVGAWRRGSWRGMGDDRDVAFFYERSRRPRRDRELLKLNRDRELDRSIRSIYRQVLGIPELAGRAQEIMAPYDRRIEGLRTRRLEVAQMTVESEIALRMLHQEVAGIQDRHDVAAIEALLTQVL
jgi:hypothetical protein